MWSILFQGSVLFALNKHAGYPAWPHFWEASSHRLFSSKEIKPCLLAYGQYSDVSTLNKMLNVFLIQGNECTLSGFRSLQAWEVIRPGIAEIPTGKPPDLSGSHHPLKSLCYQGWLSLVTTIAAPESRNVT